MVREDASLVRDALEGDKEAFGELIDRYYKVISVLAYQKVRSLQDAEDVTQESFLKSYRSLASSAGVATGRAGPPRRHPRSPTNRYRSR